MIAILDYSAGNLRSVADAVHRVGGECIITADLQEIIKADRVIIPGVGAASVAMESLRSCGLDQLIPTLTQPVLGICIGLQLMCRHSEEGDVDGMAIFDTNVTKFKLGSVGPDGRLLKIPHMGWNSVNEMRSPLFDSIDDGSYFYYVHSYAPELCAESIATSEHGVRFSGAINVNNFYGTQFHPEKSGEIGEMLIKNFLSL